MLRDQLATQLKEAMKAKDTDRLGTVRLIQAAIKDRDIANRGAGKGEASDDEILQILAKMVKQRDESAKIYQENGRPELAAKERGEIAVIQDFLPKQLSDGEVRANIAERGRQAPPEREHPRDAHADEARLLRIHRRGAHREPELREAEEEPEKHHDSERDVLLLDQLDHQVGRAANESGSAERAA